MVFVALNFGQWKKVEKREKEATIAIAIFLLQYLKIYWQHFIYSIGKPHRVKTSFKLLWQEINVIKIDSLFTNVRFSNVVSQFSFVSNIILKMQSGLILPAKGRDENKLTLFTVYLDRRRRWKKIPSQHCAELLKLQIIV